MHEIPPSSSKRPWQGGVGRDCLMLLCLRITPRGASDDAHHFKSAFGSRDLPFPGYGEGSSMAVIRGLMATPLSFRFCFPSIFVVSDLPFSHPLSRNSDSGSYSKFSSPLATAVRAFLFIAGETTTAISYSLRGLSLVASLSSLY